MPKELLQIMKEKAESVQAAVSQVHDLEDAFRYATELTLSKSVSGPVPNFGGGTVAAPGLSHNELNILQKQCDARGIHRLRPPLRIHMGDIHTAITFADWGIAETGTLVLDSTSEDIRICTMLAEIHVAILPISKIRPDVMSLEKELDALQKSAPRYLAFISGPSRTADIERVMTIGVHGPGELHILLTEENEL